jgi:alpha-tubulin suppressor-like RCC1 family protein
MDMTAHQGLIDPLVPTRMIDSGATSVSVGGDIACAIQNGGAVCWGGYAGAGELGNGTTSGSPTPVAVTSLTSGVLSLSAGSFFACAVTAAGSVACWGYGGYGQVGNAEFASSVTPVPVSGLSRGVKAVSAGFESACALKDDGTVACWGYADDGDLGDETTDFGSGFLSAVPVEVKGLSGPAALLSTGSAPCVVLTTGGVECWGLTCEEAEAPVQVVSYATEHATAVSLGGDSDSHSFACATRLDDVGSCWGDNDEGELGDGTLDSSSTPVILAEASAASLSASQGGQFACGILSGQVECWGDNSSGQLGDGTTQSRSTPLPVQNLSGRPLAVSAGGTFACALMAADSASTLYCWGDNTSGQLGDGTTTSRGTPAPVQGLAGITTITLGADFACVLLANGSADCWGDNALGQLGNGSPDSTGTPTPVAGLAGITSVAAGTSSACAIVAGGGIVCWGNNSSQQLNFTFESSPVPVPSPVSTGATAVAVGAQSTCAIVNGGATCWGCVADGQAGAQVNTCLGRLSTVTGLTAGVTAISVGYSAACAVADQGELFCWGFNSAGQLGNGGAVNDLVATPIAGL